MSRESYCLVLDFHPGLRLGSAEAGERLYIVVRRLQRFLNEAQDENRAAITQQAVRKKEAYTYVLKIMC